MTITGRLQPKSARLKRLIASHGAEWEVLRIEPMPCFNGSPGVQLRSLTGDGKVSNVELEFVLIPANP